MLGLSKAFFDNDGNVDGDDTVRTILTRRTEKTSKQVEVTHQKYILSTY